MADTQTHANGIENGLDEEDLTKLRPADIDADVKEMERRKRVEMIMNSKLFREELERIIEMQMKDGNGPAGLLQQISDMMGIQAGKLHTTNMFRGSNCVTPINDIRGVESMAYAKGEKHLRCKLASVFRLMDLYGWSQGIHNQITVRLNQDEEHFLVNPYGMLYNEITASSLVKVDMQGSVVEPGTTNFTVNTQVFLLHSSIHASRPDIKCIIHIHTPSVLAVSSLKCGLLPLCQEALVIGDVSQHPFVSGIFEPEEREKIIRNLGPTNKILLLHNHGALCCGETVEEAFFNVYNTVLACETQIKLMPMGVENLVLVNDETRKQVYDAAHRAPEGDGDKKVKHFRVGELEFEALIRMLDNAGFRTGYIYRHPLVKGEVPKPKNDVEVPPAVSSLGYLIEEEKLYKQGNWKKYVDGRNRLDRTKWLNSPNVYQKVEILETGTPDPKKITKWVDQNSEEWVAENSPTHSSTPVKIDSALQFVPKNTNPKEFKKLQQQIKENRLADKITSGPQSHILEGVTWEEAKKLQDANITQTGDQVILVGAASKGIIQRNYQHNALVYKTPYAKNPFDSISDKEIEDYKRLVERKQRGDTDYEESQSESEAVSSRQEALRHIKSPLMSPQSATSETEEESRDEPRVLRIETKTAPQPIQAEVVLSDAEFDTTDARVERSQSARYPKAEKPESVTIVNSFRKSWSLKRDKEKNKDIEIPDVYMSRVLDSSIVLKPNSQPEEPLHSCVARITNLKQKPVLIDVRNPPDGGIYKSASDPCNLAAFDDDIIQPPDDCQKGSSDSGSSEDLKRRLKLRKKVIYTAKMRFLGLDDEVARTTDSSPGSRVRTLISEIRDKINEVMSPDGEIPSMGWIPRQKFVCRNICPGEEKREDSICDGSISFGSDSASQAELEGSFKKGEDSIPGPLLELVRKENTDIREDAHVIKSLLTEIVTQVEAPENDVTYTVDRETSVQECSFDETTETEWYYNKTILKPDNSQTVLEIKEPENEGGNFAKQSDTGIETDLTSERYEDKSENDSSPMVKSTKQSPEDALLNSMLNKSSETDSSVLKSSSGRTSIDVDTSFAFKTETETSERLNEESDVEEKDCITGEEGQKKLAPSQLPGIPESPEFTNIDTEDAPVTSSSKGSSPEVVDEHREPEHEVEVDCCNNNINISEAAPKPPKKKKRKNKKRSLTKITVKKEVTDKDSQEPVVNEIKLTIKNSSNFAKESYEFEIQDETNTSGEMSRTASSMGESCEGFESNEAMEKSCECTAQKDLETLQTEVTTSIGKLQNIGQYFEDEINSMHFDEECVFTCNYREAEEVLANEGRAIITASKVNSEEPDTFPVKSNSITDLVTPAGEEKECCNEAVVIHESEVPEVACSVEVITEPETVAKMTLNDLIDVDCLLNEVILNAKNEKSNTIVDIHDFIMNDGESTVDSLTEDVVSVADGNTDEESTKDDSKRKRISDTFNVFIATPEQKEIFINYDDKLSSSFNLGKHSAKCNSYISTDDINDDFEDNPEWFSICSSGKISGNTSFDSAVSHTDGVPSPVELCSCADYNETSGTLAIIEEVEEGDCGQLS